MPDLRVHPPGLRGARVMTMTRKQFAALAWELRQEYPVPMPTPDSDLASDFYAGRCRGWERAVTAVARACEASIPRFDRGRFEAAAGLIRQPNGAMYPMADPS